MSLLDSNDYPAIRGAVGRGIDDTTAPAQDIEDPLVLPAAERWVEKETAGLTLTEEQTARAREACIYYAAYLVAPSWQTALAAAHAMRTGGAGGVPNAQQISAECRRRAEYEIGLLKGLEIPDRQDAPTSFAVPVEAW